jgi:oxygen-independent coproporphyrinogen III oxidase
LELPESCQFAELRTLAPYGGTPAVYIHVPFCGVKCGYCDFYSLPFDADTAGHAEIIDAILRQLRGFGDVLQPAGYSTVYIGGGTPNILPPRQFQHLVEGTAACVGPRNGEEWTVELNPEYVSEEYIRLLEDSPVTRISVGVQSFSDNLLRRIGRRCTARQAEIALEMISKRYTGEVSIDLLCCIPGQREAETAADIASAVCYSPGHISYYTLTVEEGTPLAAAAAKGGLDYPDEETSLRLWETGKECLTSAGYAQYEVSNFALPGKECRHNIHYWEMDPYIGCGPGAVSTIPTGRGAFRYETKRTLSDELEVELERIDARTFLLEYLMMGFRMTRGIAKERFRTTFNREFGDIFDSELERWKSAGLVCENDSFVRVTEAGQRVVNRIVLEAAVGIDNFWTA